MKSLWKLSALVAVAVSGTVAHADVIPTNTATGSELVLFVRNISADNFNPTLVYARGLGVTLDTVMTQAQVSGAYDGIGTQFSYTLPSIANDPALAAFLGASPAAGDFVWTVMAADTLGSGAFQQRYLTTTPVDPLTFPTPQNITLTSVWNQAQGMFQGLNAAIPGTTVGSPTSVSINGQWGQSGTPFENAIDWFAGQLPNENILGAAANLYLFSNGSTDGNELARAFSLGQLTLNFDGSLSLTPNTPAVPLPPALFLLGSAFAGLAGVARRKSNAAAAA